MTSERAQNVLLVVLDTVRAESSYVTGRDLTPGLANVADKGLSFERAITPAPWTFPAHASIFTGKYPTEHGATQMSRALPESHWTLAERFSDGGFRTAIFSGNGFLTETYDMTRGFETAKFVRADSDSLFERGVDPVEFLQEHKDGFGYRDIVREILDGPIVRNAANFSYYKALKKVRELRYGTNTPLHRWDDRTAKQAKSWINDRADQSEPFFAVVNLIEAHAPWQFDPDVLRASGVKPKNIAPTNRWETAAEKSGGKFDYASGNITVDETERELLTHMYESWVHRADSLATDILQTLENRKLADETLVVVTSDHGELIANEGDMGHTTSVGESVAHVPLAISGPGVPRDTVSEPVSLKDLFGTVLELTDISGGHPSLLDTSARGRALIETDGPHQNESAKFKREAPHLWGKKRALYTADGWVERRYFQDEVHGDESLLDELNEVVDGLANGPEANDEIDPSETDVGEHLQDLGYLG